MQNICRTCLAPITGKISFSINETVCLNDSQESVSVKKMIKNCVPEMALDMIQEAVVCNDCLVTLSSSYKFKLTCLKNEKKLQDFVGSSTKNLNFAIIFKNEEVETTVDINTPNLHTCNICEKTFMSENFLKKHMKTHENNYKYECGVCGKIFNEPVRLKVHILTHEETEQQDTISQDEKDYDESVSSKVAPFMLATNQIHDSIEGKFEVVSVAENKEESFKLETRKIWTDEETLQFLNLCKHHIKDMYQGPKKSLWALIAKKLGAKNIQVTHEQCERKWKTLKRAHRNLKSRLMFNKNLSMTKFSYYNQVEDILKEEAHYKVNLDSLQRLLETSIDEDDYSNELKSTAAKRPKLEEVLSDDS